jgi:hypothetical protein
MYEHKPEYDDWFIYKKMDIYNNNTKWKTINQLNYTN